MALPLSPKTRQNLKDILICFSLGNLCFVRRWYDLEILNEPGLDYHRVAPPSPLLLTATLIAGLMLATVFYVGLQWARRGGARRIKLAHGTFMMALIFPLESVRRYWNLQLGHYDLASNVALLCIEALLMGGVVLAMKGNDRVVRAAKHVALMMVFMFPALLLDFAGARMSAEPAAAYQPRESAPRQFAAANSPRVIWMIFDEMDERVAFDARPADLELPELDRLRAESFEGRRAIETAEWTSIALPSLIDGRFFRTTSMAGASKLEVTPEGSAQKEDWRDEPSVFQRAEAMGINVALSGWYHPYCRIFGDQLVDCYATPSGHAGKAMLRERHASQNGLWNTIAFLFQLQFENLKDVYRFDGKSGSEDLKAAYLQNEQQQEYFHIRDHAYQYAVDPSVGFLFVHVPAPHMYAIYNRREKSFKLNPALDYLDNLALVDRTVGELRKKLEDAGLWDRTTLLITADHGFRPNLWSGNYGWTPTMEKLFAAGSSPTVPFILKLAGQEQHVVFDRPFSNIVSGDLMLSVLGGQLKSGADVVSWFDSHAAGSMQTATPHSTGNAGGE